MMYSNKKSHIAAICVSRVALAYLVFGAGGAFPLFADWSNSDASRLASIQGDIYTLVLHLASQSPSMEEDLSVLRTAVSNTGIGSISDGSGQYPVSLLGLLRGWVESGNVSAPAYLSQYNRGLLYYSGASHDILTNLDYKVSTISDKLSYDSGDGEESIAEIVADIRDRMTNQTDFALGVAFTNLATALAYVIPYTTANTNYNSMVQDLGEESYDFAREYGLSPYYYNSLFSGLPFYHWNLTQQFMANEGIPSSFRSNLPYFNIRQRWLNSLVKGNPSVYSNLYERTNKMRYDSYNTFQSRVMLSNLFYNANMVTWTNMQAAGISPNNYAMQWFDSYNTKFQNMLLEYGTLAAITNENIQQVQFARNWYDSYSPRVILEYLLNSDFLNGTNSLSDTLEALDDKVDSYSLSKLPTFGMNTNSASIDMGVINATPDSGYKSVGDDIKDQDYNQASYLNEGWKIFDAVQDKYENAIDIIIGQIFELDGGDSKAFRDGDDGGGGGLDSVGLSLRVNSVRFRDPFTQQETTIIPEDYIDFTLPSKAKDKLEDYWSLIKAALEWGMWIWAFLYCWNLLAGSDTKQSSPTILD